MNLPSTPKVASLLFCLFFNPTQALATTPGDSIRVTISEGTNMAVALAPDGKTLALDLQGTIYTMPSDGGTATSLTDGLGDERQPTWSPDGSRIAFQSYRDGNYHLWTVRKDGSELKQLTFGIYDDREPHWSPDGTRILFSSDRNGNYDIWEVVLATEEMKQLTTDPADDYNPAWSADGSRIAFISSRKEDGLYVRDPKGNEQLLVPTSGTLAAPAWSPDDKQITFNQVYQGKSQLLMATLGSGQVSTLSNPNEDVFPFRTSWISAKELLYTADGKIKRRILNKKAPKNVEFKAILTVFRASYPRKLRDFDAQAPRKTLGIMGPVVSPDGQSVVFTALGNLWLLKGSATPQQLTNDAAIDIDPTWSPDGQKIAFVSDREGKMNLWVRDMPTGKEIRLTNVEDDVMFPSWSPDGKQIAFLLNDARNVWGMSTLNVISSDAGDVKMSESTGKTGEVKLLHTAMFVPGKPTWSTDGKTIALSFLQPYSARYREGISRILLVSTEGKPDRFLSPLIDRTLATRGKNGPVWSPDGRKMAYIQDGVLCVIPVSLNGDPIGPPRRLTNELSDVPSWTGDSNSLVYLAVDRLKRVYLSDSHIEDIPLSLSWQPQMPTGQVVIHAGKLFDGRAATYRTNVDIVLEANRIREIVPHQANRTGTVIDASGKTIMPGLFEMHSHQYAGVGEVLGRIWLAYGITSVRETGADPYDALERKEAWASGVRPGPREFFTGSLTDGERIYYGMSNSVSNGAQLDMELERAVKLDYDLIKTYVRLSDALQKRITAFAHAYGIPVSSHEIYPASAYGVDAVEHIRGTSRRGYSPKQTALNRSYQDVIQLIAKSGMTITPTIVLSGGFHAAMEKDPAILKNKQFQALYPENFVNNLAHSAEQIYIRYPELKYNFVQTQRVVRTLIDAGARVTPGTDSPFVPYGLSLQTELQNFVDGGLSPYEALRSATLWSAEAIGVEKDLGTLEAGKLADLVIVEGDPLVHIQDAMNVVTVWKNGVRYDTATLLKQKP